MNALALGGYEYPEFAQRSTPSIVADSGVHKAAVHTSLEATICKTYLILIQRYLGYCWSQKIIVENSNLEIESQSLLSHIVSRDTIYNVQTISRIVTWV